MTQPEALAAAQQHIAQCNADSPLPADYRWAVGEPEEYRDFWYFDYVIVHRLGLPSEAWDEQFSGAPGYAVAKRDQAIHVVGWHLWPQLREEEARLQSFEQVAAGLARQPLTLQLLRPHFSLPLLALRAFRQEIEALPPPQKRRRLQAQLMREAHYWPLLGFEED